MLCHMDFWIQPSRFIDLEALDAFWDLGSGLLPNPSRAKWPTVGPYCLSWARAERTWLQGVGASSTQEPTSTYCPLVDGNYGLRHGLRQWFWWRDAKYQAHRAVQRATRSLGWASNDTDFLCANWAEMQPG